ncbi:hypothetical protein HDE_06244 [Halotydeus destructor]|nr:hypothetical protein HDE_06244 [Halotydeus destructor]
MSSRAKTNKPWYYVQGRPDLTEKRLSNKREKQAQREKECTKNSNYFDRWKAQNELFNQWDKNYEQNKLKNLLYKTKPIAGGSGDDAQYRKDLSEKELKVLEFAQQIHRIESKLVPIYEKEQIYLNHLRSLKITNQQFDALFAEWDTRKKKVMRMRVPRDRLRHRTFLTLEQLHYIDSFIDKWLKLSKSLQLSKQEEEQFSSCLSSAKHLIATFLGLNSERNTELVCLYNEEAFHLLHYFEDQWDREESVWFSSFAQIVSVIKSTLAEKVEDSLKAESKLLAEKEKIVRQLMKFSASNP